MRHARYGLAVGSSSARQSSERPSHGSVESHPMAVTTAPAGLGTPEDPQPTPGDFS